MIAAAPATDLTLSIVSHGHGELLALLLADLAALPAARQARILLTLNLHDEPFDAEAHAPLQIEMLRNPRPQGFGANHNAALRRCTTSWFAVLNPDLRLPDNPFPALFEAARCIPDVALLAPRVLSPGGTLEDSVRGNLTPYSLIKRRLLGQRAPRDVSAPVRCGEPFCWFAGMFLMLRADAMRAVGGFDERFFMYCEDYDLCARLYLAGHTLALVPEAQVIHAAQRDSHRAIRALLRHVRSLLRVWTSSPVWRVG